MSRGATPIRVRRERGSLFSSQAGPVFHRRKLWWLLACAGLAVALGFTYVWQYIHTNVIGYRLLEVQMQNAALRADIARLRNEAAQLAAPARIDSIARQHLGMVRQDTWDLVLLPSPKQTPPPPLQRPATFWEIQEHRWARVSGRLHATLGPGRALAEPTPPREVRGE